MINNTNTSQKNVKNNEAIGNTEGYPKSTFKSKIKNALKKIIRPINSANKISIPTSGNNPHSFNRIGRTKLIQINESKKEDKIDKLAKEHIINEMLPYDGFDESDFSNERQYPYNYHDQLESKSTGYKSNLQKNDLYDISIEKIEKLSEEMGNVTDTMNSIAAIINLDKKTEFIEMKALSKPLKMLKPAPQKKYNQIKK